MPAFSRDAPPETPIKRLSIPLYSGKYSKYSRSSGVTPSKKVVSFSGNLVGWPTANQRHSPVWVFTYKSIPLTPVAAKCGIAKFSPVRDHLAFSEEASVLKRTYIPDVCPLKFHTAAVTFPSALAGNRRKKLASSSQPLPSTFKLLISIQVKLSVWSCATVGFCKKINHPKSNSTPFFTNRRLSIDTEFIIGT